LNKKDLYQKPKLICKTLTEKDEYLINLNDQDFIAAQKKEIEEELKSYGYDIRLANYNDIDALNTFIEARYIKLEGNELSTYDYYRFIKFGTGLILHKDKEICACVFEIAYDKPQRTSYPLRLVLDEGIKGNNIGLLMVLYLSLIAKKRGSEINRSVISFDNHVSIYVQVNKQGWILNGMNANIKGLTNYFEACIPLSKTGLMQNKIDMQKLVRFINTHDAGQDYLLIESNDLEAVQECFKKDFLITAFIREGIIDDHHYFFAMPAEELKLLRING
jgi:hypothetical protein